MSTFVNFVNFYVRIDLYYRFWLASAQKSSETIVLFKNAECSRSFALDNFSFLWYDPFVGLMVFAIILYHKKKSLALPFRSVPGSFSLLGLQQSLYSYRTFQFDSIDLAEIHLTSQQKSCIIKT